MRLKSQQQPFISVHTQKQMLCLFLEADRSGDGIIFAAGHLDRQASERVAAEERNPSSLNRLPPDLPRGIFGAVAVDWLQRLLMLSPTTHLPA